MTEEITRSRIALLDQIADEYSHDSASGAEEVSFLLRRAAKMMTAIAGGETVVMPPMPGREDEDVSDVRAG